MYGHVYTFHIWHDSNNVILYMQILSSDLEWKECADLPSRISFAQATVIDDQVFVGGCDADGVDIKALSTVYCYNLRSDEWSTLGYLQATAGSFQHMLSVSSSGDDSICHEASNGDAQLEPIVHFGLGKYPFVSEGAVKIRLVAVGGFQGGTAINDVHVYAGDGRFKKWEPYPSMKYCRCKCSVISHVERSTLIVAGGNSLADQTGQLSSVELFQSGIWYQCMKLCFPCERFSSVLIDDKCYLLGGYKDWDGLIRAAMCTSIEEMMIAHESVDGDSSDEENGVFNDAECDRESSKISNIRSCVARSSSIPSPWQKLGMETPNYASSSAYLLKSIVAVGGKSKDGEAKSAVHFFSPAINQWVQIATLPFPLISPTIAMLSATEFLAIGGGGNGVDAKQGTKKVFKATLKFYAPQQKHLTL